MNNTVKITILVNNVADSSDLISEHGFAMYVQSGGMNIIFDTGQDGRVFENNVIRIGIEQEEANAVVLSHGHYDHSGGLPAVLSMCGDLDFYAHPGVVQPRYSVRPERIKSNGIPAESCKAIQGLPDERLHWINGPLMLSDNIGITGYIPRNTEFEDRGGPFFYDRQGHREDPVSDDQALWIKTAKGLVVCVGCSHAGIVNTLNYVRVISGVERIHAVIGGLHLVNASEERIEKTIAALDAFDPALIVGCHCTGATAMAGILNYFKMRAVVGAAGRSFCFDM